MVILTALQLSLSVFNALWYGKHFLKNPNGGRFLLVLLPLFLVVLSTLFLARNFGVDTTNIDKEVVIVLSGIGMLTSGIQSYAALREIME